MTFRQRITLASAAAVAIAVVLASVLVYLLTAHQLHNQVDNQLGARAEQVNGEVEHRLSQRAESMHLSAGDDDQRTRQALQDLLKRRSELAGGANGNPLRSLPPRPNQVRGYQQLVDSAGHIVFKTATNISLPVGSSTKALAAHAGEGVYSTARVQGIHLRILSEHIARGYALELAQPLTEDDSLLGRLRLILALLDVGGIALAALLGRLVAGAAVQPLKRLSQTTEHVARTGDLSGRIRGGGEDEISRLASSFNSMLDALEQSMGALDASVHAQRQLVADASHELRTPVTSLRTNIEVLQQQAADIDPEEQSLLLAEAVQQTEELTRLINDLIDLARGEEPPTEVEEVRLDLLVAEVAQRAIRNSPATPLTLDLQPTILPGVPARLERAVSNLIDNAIKYSPMGTPVEVLLRGERLSVRDHGPGINDEDLPHVFDRFYRGAEARGRPGSGLGLAIVHQVAVQQGGSITVEHASGRDGRIEGTLMVLHLPGTEPAPPEPASDPGPEPARQLAER